jgi:hypothetical protein
MIDATLYVFSFGSSVTSRGAPSPDASSGGSETVTMASATASRYCGGGSRLIWNP